MTQNLRMRTSYVPVMHCEKNGCHQRAVNEFLVKEGNWAGVNYERLRGVYGDVCTVPAVSEGG
jgi:hypothetical protein